TFLGSGAAVLAQPLQDGLGWIEVLGLAQAIAEEKTNRHGHAVTSARDEFNVGSARCGRVGVRSLRSHALIGAIMIKERGPGRAVAARPAAGDERFGGPARLAPDDATIERTPRRGEHRAPGFELLPLAGAEALFHEHASAAGKDVRHDFGLRA